MISRDEFERSLVEPISFWSQKSKETVKILLGEEVSRMVGFNQQNPHHCYDLFIHTLQTVENLRVNASTILKVAAFFHDIGKPYVAQEKQGRLVFYGHAQKSADISKPILISLGYSNKEKKDICFFISHHDDFISWVLPTETYNHDNPYLIEITTDNVKSHIEKAESKENALYNKKIQKKWYDLLQLCKADATAQSDLVYQYGTVIDSREHKLEKLQRIQGILQSFSI